MSGKKIGRPVLNDTIEKKHQAYEKNKEATNKRIKELNDSNKERNKLKIDAIKQIIPNCQVKATSKGLTVYIPNSQLDKY